MLIIKVLVGLCSLPHQYSMQKSASEKLTPMLSHNIQFTPQHDMKAIGNSQEWSGAEEKKREKLWDTYISYV